MSVSVCEQKKDLEMLENRLFLNSRKIRELLSLLNISEAFSSLFFNEGDRLNNRYSYVCMAKSLSDYVSEFHTIPEFEKGIKLIVEDIQNIATNIDSMTTSTEGKTRLSNSSVAKLIVIVDGINVLFRWFALLASSIETHCASKTQHFDSALQNSTVCSDKLINTRIHQLVFDFAMLAELNDKTNEEQKQACQQQFLEMLLDFQTTLDSIASSEQSATIVDRRLVRLASHVNVCCARAAGRIKSRFDTLSKSILPIAGIAGVMTTTVEQ